MLNIGITYDHYLHGKSCCHGSSLETLGLIDGIYLRKVASSEGALSVGDLSEGVLRESNKCRNCLSSPN